jgi:hypothetical protein
MMESRSGSFEVNRDERIRQAALVLLDIREFWTSLSSLFPPTPSHSSLFASLAYLSFRLLLFDPKQDQLLPIDSC